VSIERQVDDDPAVIPESHSDSGLYPSLAYVSYLGDAVPETDRSPIKISPRQWIPSLVAVRLSAQCGSVLRY
jgi:hypothetical protein